MSNFNINLAGFCIAGLFVLVWTVALIYWRVGNVEERWSASVPQAPAVPAPPEAGQES
jgi:high-affinity nickel-transport protein